jgi:hypothetical protein
MMINSVPPGTDPLAVEAARLLFLVAGTEGAEAFVRRQVPGLTDAGLIEGYRLCADWTACLAAILRDRAGLLEALT